MKLMRAATLSVADLKRSMDTYCEWLDYSVEEQGRLDSALAASWGTPKAAPGGMHNRPNSYPTTNQGFQGTGPRMNHLCSGSVSVRANNPNVFPD